MNEVLWTLLLLVWLIRWAFLSARFRKMEDRLDALERENRHLSERLSGVVYVPEPEPVLAEPVREPVFAATPPPLPPEWIAPAAEEPLPQPELEPVPARPSWRDRFQGEEWEALVGGNLLSKLGVLALVIGVALFLGYSLTRFGPVGKIAIGYVVGVTMLLAGIALERRALYVVIGRGLIGGGWALTYFTTYAAHGLDASRVVQSPVAGFLLLLLAALAMVVHSLRYRAETATGMAFFAAFAALNLHQTTTPSLLATLPLAAFLLAVSHRLGWSGLPIAGLIFTYGSFAIQYDVRDVPPGGAVWVGALVLWSYWFLFEAFDLWTLRKRGGTSLFLLNAAGLFFVQLLPTAPRPADPTVLLFAASAVLLGSAIVRGRMKVADAPEGDRLLLGGYEASISLSAISALAAILRGYTGWAINTGILMEGEFLVLAGLTLRRRFLPWLGAAVIAVAFGKVLSVDLPETATLAVLGRTWYQWTLVAILTAAVCVLNRALTRQLAAYTYAATVLLAAVVFREMPPVWQGLGWLVLAAVVVESRRWFAEARNLGAAVGAVAVATLLVVVLMRDTTPDTVLVLSLAAALLTAAAWRVHGREDAGTFAAVSSCATILVLGAMAHGLPPVLVGLGWAVVWYGLLELGLARHLPALRWQAHAVAALVVFRLLGHNIDIGGATGPLSHRLLTVLPVVGLFYWWWHRLERREADRNERLAGRTYSYAALVLLTTMLAFELSHAGVVVGWAFYGLALLLFGWRLPHADLRLQAYGLAVLAFGRGWATNLNLPDSLGGAPVRLATGAAVIAAFYAGQLFSPRAVDATGTWRQRLDHWARPGYSLLGTVLLTLVVVYEASGTLLTVSLGLEGVALLAAGFVLRERVFRLSGIVLLLMAIAKLFTYDVWHMDVLVRIGSLIALGLLLLGVSVVYSRHREQVRRLL